MRSPDALLSRTLGARARAGALAVGALVAAALLTACAAPVQPAASAQAGTTDSAGQAPVITVPPTNVGTWYDLGHDLSRWLAGDAPVPVSGAAAPTRAAGLLREDGRWLAVVVVQAAPYALAVPGCPAPTNDLVVESGTHGGDCLRFRRDADYSNWLASQHSALKNWLDTRAYSSPPRAWVGHRVVAGGKVTEVHALLDPSLIEPVTRNNADFLVAGQPGLDWARRLAAATRAASGSGTLDVPPFPFAPQVAPPPPPVKAKPLPPAQRKPGPVLAPRRERG